MVKKWLSKMVNGRRQYQRDLRVREDIARKLADYRPAHPRADFLRPPHLRTDLLDDNDPTAEQRR